MTIKELIKKNANGESFSFENYINFLKTTEKCDTFILKVGSSIFNIIKAEEIDADTIIIEAFSYDNIPKTYLVVIKKKYIEFCKPRQSEEHENILIKKYLEYLTREHECSLDDEEKERIQKHEWDC